MADALILGIGNILLRDEGVGVRAVEAMGGMELPDGVELLDGGTSGADLVDEVANRRKLIVIDAAKGDAPPGTIYRFGADDLLPEAKNTISLHEFGLLDTLMMAGHLGCAPREVIIFGVQPKDVSTGLELSEDVRRVLPKLVDLVLSEAASANRAD